MSGSTYVCSFPTKSWISLFNLKKCLEDIEDMSLRHVFKTCLFIRHYKLRSYSVYDLLDLVVLDSLESIRWARSNDSIGRLSELSSTISISHWAQFNYLYRYLLITNRPNDFRCVFEIDPTISILYYFGSCLEKKDYFLWVYRISYINIYHLK